MHGKFMQCHVLKIHFSAGPGRAASKSANQPPIAASRNRRKMQSIATPSPGDLDSSPHCTCASPSIERTAGDATTSHRGWSREQWLTLGEVSLASSGRATHVSRHRLGHALSLADGRRREDGATVARAALPAVPLPVPWPEPQRLLNEFCLRIATLGRQRGQRWQVYDGDRLR